MDDGISACRAGENSISGLCVPIIFVPGIMGSRFDIPAVSDSWDPDSTFNMLGWSFMSTADKRDHMDWHHPGTVMTALPTAFTNPLKKSERKSRGWGGVRWASYVDFLTVAEDWKFASNRTPVYAYGYDWRQPIVQLGCQLAADLTGETVTVDGNAASPDAKRFGPAGLLAQANADKCLILTHSMGGLVTRAALKACPTLAGKTVGVLHGVQPATGAPLMYRRLITGAYSPYDGSEVAEKVLEKILGNTGDDFGGLVSVIAGAMQLLPSNLYRDACESLRVHLVSWTVFLEGRTPAHWSSESVYDTYNRSQIDNPPGVIRSTLDAPVQDDLRKRLIGVKRFHDYLGDWKLGDKTWAFFGAAVPTDFTLHFDLPPTAWTVSNSGGFLGIGGGKVYTATDSSGSQVALDYERDILRNGFNPTVPGDLKGDVPAGFACYGDGTVAQPSADALFPSSQTVQLDSLTPPDYSFNTNRQFLVVGLKHEPAYRDACVQRLVKAWIEYMINSIPRK